MAVEKDQVSGNDQFPGNDSIAIKQETTTPYIGPSVLITIFGILTNLLSMSYFITHRNPKRKSHTETLNKRLFIVLNFFDIFVCIFLLAMLFTTTYDTKNSMWSIVAFFVAAQNTGFITCLLSAIRAISIFCPQHRLNAKVMIVSLILYSVLMIYSNVQHFNLNEKLITTHFSILSGLFAVIILCNGLCIANLLLSEVSPWKREVTITVGILSCLYCVFNVGFLVNYGFFIFKCGIRRDIVCLSPTFERTSMYILLPLDSACNPVVFFLRNAEMRRFLKVMWGKVWGSRPGAGDDEVQDRIEPGMSGAENRLEHEQDITISNVPRENTENVES